MADEKNFRDKQEETPFIREKIVKRPLGKLEIARRIVVGILLAAIFGVVAGGTFALGSRLGKEPEENQETEIVWTEAEETKETEERPSDISASEEDLDNRIESIVEEKLEESQSGISGLEQMRESVQSMLKQVEKASVKLLVTQQGKDWFDQTYQNQRETSAFILRKTEQEIYVLTGRGLLENAVSVNAVFDGSTEIEAEIWAQDSLTGMAVLRIPLEGVAANTVSGLAELPLGLSAGVKAGDPVIALGSPLGVGSSVSYTYINYVQKNKPLTDSSWTMLYTDLQSFDGASGILINMQGEMIGWICSAYKESGLEKLTAAVGITDVQYVLEALCNQKKIPYLGIVGRDVTEEIASEQNLPEGVYLTTIEENSPAYMAGLQNGDVIVAVDGKEIKNMKQLTSALNEMSPEDRMEIRAVRSGREESRELTFQAVLMAR